MANQYKNKIVYNGTILLDLSGDTVTLPEHIMAGFVGHLSDGRQVTGTGQGGGTAAISVVDTEDSHGGTIRTVTALDISDTTAVAADVAQGKYFYTAQGIKTLGTASGGGSVSWTTLFDQTVQVYEDEQPPNYCFFSRGNDTIAVGDVYRVSFNGVTSTLTAKTANNRIVIGNPGIINSSLDDSSGLTYCIYDNDDTYKLLLTSESENQYSLKVEKQVQSGGSSGQTVTGTVTGSGTDVLEIPCSFEPDLIYVHSDLSDDATKRGVVSITIIKDRLIDMHSDASTSAASETMYYASHDVTGYNENDDSNPHASYANGVLTITSINSSATKFLSGQVYNYELSTIGTGGSSTPSATSHSIYFEFSDGTNTTLTYYDNEGTFINSAITATTPTTYGGKNIEFAQLDGVTWYEASNIPLNTELVDISTVTFGYGIGEDGTPEEYEWSSITDYIRIDPSMTFSYTCNKWSMYAYYDNTKNTIRVVEVSDDIDSDDGSNIGYGTLTPSKIPSNAVYVRLTGGYQPSSNASLSLIRTA